MAQVVLGAFGRAVGGGAGAAIGSALGALADRSLIESLKPARQVGPRLDGLRVTSTAEGAGVLSVFGRARVSGQVIWAARFRERREEGRSGGAKGGRNVAYEYSLSFAVALCEGPIDGVGRVWADGQPLDTAGLTMRVHRGGPEQQPDPLIEAVEGAAPAYRGTAYAVFEDLPLGPYGNRPPQLSFEVFRGFGGEGSLEDRLEGVCLIPGAGEFVYATDAVVRREGIARYRSENVHTGESRADLLVSLDQLQAHLPNLKRVSLVVSWFGDDLRCGACRVRPGVETREKATHPWAWRAGGVGRDEARLLSGGPETPAFGGTPADRAVLQAIAALKARGLEVTLYPLLMMDVAAGNGLADPYGGAKQAAFPWRGRITCSPAPGRPGSPDGTAGAEAQVAAFFGTAAAGEFGEADGLPTYGGADGWSYRRMVLHYARLAQLAGGVDGFLIGSELRGLTTVRGAGGSYPAVEALRSLANDVRAMLGPDTAIGYGADWSEWFGRQPANGSGEVTFHLDPLWADPAISYVGVDWYPPLTDWRADGGGIDATAWSGADDAGYLRAGVAGGEAFDWYYADDDARAEQARTAITDGAYGEPWVFRPKDLVGWWSRRHHDRSGGVRSAEPTAWAPGMKPIRFVEFGCPAVDRGGNAPNLFFDGRSSESARPPDSTGRRDDRMQRRALEAVLGWFAEPGNNPISDVYGGPMLAAADAWCWDARPYPAFPGRADVWTDAPSWTGGHWLNGRLGIGDGAELAAAVLAWGGLDADGFEVSGVRGSAAGYVIDRPMRVRDALAPLATAFGFDAAERDGRVALAPTDGVAGAATVLGADELAMEDEGSAVGSERALEASPSAVRVRFVDDAAEYRTGSVVVRADAEAEGGAEDLDLPVVTTAAAAEAVARRRLGTFASRERATVRLGPLAALRLEAGDRVEVDGLAGDWRVAEVRLDETASAALVRPEPAVAVRDVTEHRPGDPAPQPGPPVIHVLDLPTLPGREAETRPLVAAASEPWRALDVWAGADAASLTRRATVSEPAILGVTETALSPGPRGRVDHAASVVVRLQGAGPISRTAAEVRGGANSMALRTPAGHWEVLAFERAELVGEERWRLSRLTRGLLGTDALMAPVPAGSAAVMLDEALTPAGASDEERGLPRLWRAAPAGGPAGGAAMTETTQTWRGAGLRPWAPAHLRVRTGEDGLQVAWLRRARAGGDGWDREPPLGEEVERWRVQVRSAGGAVVRQAEVGTAVWAWSAAEQAADVGGPVPPELTIEVSQFSAVWGWGPAAVLQL